MLQESDEGEALAAKVEVRSVVVRQQLQAVECRYYKGVRIRLVPGDRRDSRGGSGGGELQGYQADERKDVRPRQA